MKKSKLISGVFFLYPIIVWGLVTSSAPREVLVALTLVAMVFWWVRKSWPIWQLVATVVGMLCLELGGWVEFHGARIYPVAVASAYFFGFAARRRGDKGMLAPMVSKFKSLDPTQLRRLKATETLWLWVVGANLLVLSGFLFVGSWDQWAVYTTVLSYLVIAFTIALTVLLVHFGDHVSKLLIRMNHIMCFSVFGLMCILGTPVVILYTGLCKIFGTDATKGIQLLCYGSFRYVKWHCRSAKFIAMDFDYSRSDGHKPRLMLCNHICLFDIVAIFSEFRHCHTFVNYVFYLNPLLRPFIRGCGFVPIDPRSINSTLQGFGKAKGILESGGQMVVFPEGTRSRDGRLGRFHIGGFKLAIETQTDITPVYFTLDKPFLNKKRFFQESRGGATLKAYVLPSILVAGYEPSREGTSQLMDDFRRALESFSREFDGGAKEVV